MRPGHAAEYRRRSGAVFLLNSTSDFSDFAPGDGSCDTPPIEGAGRGSSVIEQSAEDRVFELPFMGSGNLTLVGLTLRGGDAGTNSGGGVFNSGTTQIADSVIWGNSAEWRGGGISSASLSASGFPTRTLVVDSSTIGPKTA